MLNYAKYITNKRYLLPNSNDWTSSCITNTDFGLITLNSAEELTDRCGYLINVKHIAGDLSKILSHKVGECSSGTYYVIGYKLASYLKDFEFNETNKETQNV